MALASILAKAALAAAAHGDDDAEFNRARLISAKFFGEQLLPLADGLAGAVMAGADDLFALTAEQLQ